MEVAEQLAADVTTTVPTRDACVRVLGDLIDSSVPDVDVSRAEDHRLTTRENEVLRLMRTGLTSGAIGHLLGISARTVAKHQENAYRKLGCNNKVSALQKLADDDRRGAGPQPTRPD